MKKRNFTRKLSFNKSTIAVLDTEAQEGLRGGAIVLYTKTAYPTCEQVTTCVETFCPWTNCGDSVHTPCYC